MMSQVELWNMQEYCERKNTRRTKHARKRRSFSSLQLLVFIAGLMLFVLSVCLTGYVFRLSLAAADPAFPITGIAGCIAGAATCAVSIRIQI